MGIENSDKWKKAKSNTDKLLKNAKNAESLAGDIKIEIADDLEHLKLKYSWKETSEASSSNKLKNLSKGNPDALASNEADHEVKDKDVKNAEELMESILEKSDWKSRYEKWSGEDIA